MNFRDTLINLREGQLLKAAESLVKAKRTSLTGVGSI